MKKSSTGRWSVRASILIVIASMAIGCFQRDRSLEKQSSIIGGKVASSEFGAIGAIIEVNNGVGIFRCSGVLISARAILTAAHCISNSGPTTLRFTTLSTLKNRTLTDIVDQSVPITQRHPHLLFTGIETALPGVGQANDIGVALLSFPITAVEPIKIISSIDRLSALQVDNRVTLVGYGRTSLTVEDSGQRTMAEDVTLAEVGSFEMLIGSIGEPQSCSGDSGGAVLVDIDPSSRRDWRLVGIVSRDYDPSDPNCTSGEVDTRVDAYVDFILDYTTLPCGSAASPACVSERDASTGTSDGGSRGDGSKPSGSVGGGGVIRPQSSNGFRCAMETRASPATAATLIFVILVLRVVTALKRYRRR